MKYEEKWDVKVDGVPLADGRYSLNLLLIKEGEEMKLNAEPFKFTVDTVPPRIGSVQPMSGSRIPGSVSLSARCEDESGISQAYLLIDSDPESRVDLKVDKEGRYVTPSPLTLSPGRRSIQIHVADKAGNESVKSVSYTVTVSVKPILSLFNYPNPFVAGSTTRIVLILGTSTEEAELMIYDPTGKLVFRRKIGGEEGEHLVEWDGRDLQGDLLPRGIYFCRVVAGGEERIHKIGIR